MGKYIAGVQWERMVRYGRILGKTGGFTGMH